MEKLFYQIQINATPDKIWGVLWNDVTYTQWTSVFAEGSFYKGTLEEGSIVKFFDPKNNGMYSRVEKNIPNKEIKFLPLVRFMTAWKKHKTGEKQLNLIYWRKQETEQFLKERYKHRKNLKVSLKINFRKHWKL